MGYARHIALLSCCAGHASRRLPCCLAVQCITFVYWTRAKWVKWGFVCAGSPVPGRFHG